MSMLAAAQTDIMTFSAGDLKEALKRFDKAPDVGRMGMFTHHPNNIGVSMRVLEDVTTIEQIELQAKLLNYFLGSNKSNVNQWSSTVTEISSVHLQRVCQRTPKTVASIVQSGTSQHYKHRAG